MIKLTQHIGLLTIIIIMLASPLSGFGCRTPSPFRYLSNPPCQTTYANDAIQNNHIEQPAPILKNEFLMVIFFDLIIPTQAVSQFQPYTPTPPPKTLY